MSGNHDDENASSPSQLPDAGHFQYLICSTVHTVSWKHLKIIIIIIIIVTSSSSQCYFADVFRLRPPTCTGHMRKQAAASWQARHNHGLCRSTSCVELAWVTHCNGIAVLVQIILSVRIWFRGDRMLLKRENKVKRQIDMHVALYIGHSVLFTHVSVCLSVSPSVCHTRQPRLYGPRYRHMVAPHDKTTSF